MAIGWALDKTGSYAPMFAVAACMYIIAWFILSLLIPKHSTHLKYYFMSKKENTGRQGVYSKTIAGASMVAVASPALGAASFPARRKSAAGTLNLSDVRHDVMAFGNAMQDKEGVYGSFARASGSVPICIPVLTLPWPVVSLGEDLQASLPEQQRNEWIGHVNSFANNDSEKPPTGVILIQNGHSSLHGQWHGESGRSACWAGNKNSRLPYTMISTRKRNSALARIIELERTMAEAAPQVLGRYDLLQLQQQMHGRLAGKSFYLAERQPG